MRLGNLDDLKEAINTYDKFACLPNGKLEPFRNLEHPEMFIAYIHFDDVIKAIDNTPTVIKCGEYEGMPMISGDFTPRPQGEWEFKKFDEKTGILNSDWCPFCGKSKAQFYDNFCGNCGAQLKKGE